MAEALRNAISWTSDAVWGPGGYFDMDPDYCKGCGICARECVTGCIAMVPEEE